MKKILLFSDHREIFKTTNKITKGKYKLKWCTCDWSDDDKHFTPDVIIMYFNKKMVEKGTFEFIVRVKGMLGNTIPILALIENGTKQDIFSVLKEGVYDYLENVENLQEYQKNRRNIIVGMVLKKVWFSKRL
ncbi:response regulator [Agathobacter rectalis]|jgi:DNA-binding response OmpR family regulator|uniref:Response regulator n=1 Tax=Agathobacter rectalis TaxID=39491 RepID=A0A414IYG2_9FIRM|nr:response regulator [Agathobacter rectalis]RGT13761.1 response regulator [Agathobacter rectalis]RGT21500.1 response regulator [Agathobacter rectalis]RHE34702.1 response regulator [Agathobacter rectalis]RHL02296.1 response regulator [Agathobacter rectalis]